MLVLDWPGRNCRIHSLLALLAQVKEGEKGNTKIFGHYVILNPYAILFLGYFFRGDTESSPERYVKKTLIQSQNSISHVFSYNALP